jgi:hypothetical protein
MFSLDNFYYIVYENLLKPVNITTWYFYPFGSVRPEDLVHGRFNEQLNYRSHHAIFCDQEPLIDIHLPNYPVLASEKRCKFFVNSEYSDIKQQYCKEYNAYDWYYFFHGFAALTWYRDYKYLPQVENNFTHVFISLNRLTTKDRSYRLTLVSKLLEKDLTKHGLVSLYINDPTQRSWGEELESPDTKLSDNAKSLIREQIGKLSGSLIVDQETPRGDLSAKAGYEELKLNQKALWHVVSETVFYYDKLHLTEKIFKPIVSRRPFILVAAAGNLAYLKKYGFKTFDRWIDESYDNEKDPDKRLDMITVQIEKLSKLSKKELDLMHEEMREVLDHNFNHFYGSFREVIVEEMLENFKGCVGQWNNGRIGDKRIDLDLLDFNHIKTILSS